MANNAMFSKVRQWDNRASQWLSRHFYIFLFEIILGIIFLLAFVNALKILNTSFNVHRDNAVEQLQLAQSVNSILIVMLLILMALGVLNIINGNLRLRSILKNIEFNLSRRRSDSKSQEDQKYS